jgi:adenylate kinase
MRILFLGAPGAGKGTQCKKLSSKLNLLHLSSGDLLRDAVKNGTPAGVAAKEYMDKGQLVPDKVLIDLFREKLSQPEAANGFILDGFPRNLAQAESLDGLLQELKANLDVVIDIQIADSLLEDRITGRRVCPNKACNAVYHVKFSPPLRRQGGASQAAPFGISRIDRSLDPFLRRQGLDQISRWPG